ncbi:hypothetical protein [Pseudonocardia aurantiaca]|uniref:Uncharacterized protein n=1 Tax=Pseudonocardia aurantiaca TaxID=75290 RepID=A0ABW4FPU1_9PSEU
MRHDVRRDQELVDPVFARGLRELADRTGAVLILDDRPVHSARSPEPTSCVTRPARST